MDNGYQANGTFLIVEHDINLSHVHIICRLIIAN